MLSRYALTARADPPKGVLMAWLAVFVAVVVAIVVLGQWLAMRDGAGRS